MDNVNHEERFKEIDKALTVYRAVRTGSYDEIALRNAAKDLLKSIYDNFFNALEAPASE